VRHQRYCRNLKSSIKRGKNSRFGAIRHATRRRFNLHDVAPVFEQLTCVTCERNSFVPSRCQPGVMHPRNNCSFVHLSIRVRSRGICQLEIHFTCPYVGTVCGTAPRSTLTICNGNFAWQGCHLVLLPHACIHRSNERQPMTLRGARKLRFDQNEFMCCTLFHDLVISSILMNIDGICNLSAREATSFGGGSAVGKSHTGCISLIGRYVIQPESTRLKKKKKKKRSTLS
jgi:hypothetical protein